MKTTRVLAALALASAATVGALVAAPASAAASRPAAAQASAESAQYAIDTVHSSIIFSIRHNNVSDFYGRFNEFDGSFKLADGGSVNINIKPASVDTGNQRRDNHLRNSDFFSAMEFPELSFKSQSVRKTGDNTFEATGTLTCRGVSKPLTVTIERTGMAEARGKKVAGMKSTFTIKRSDFNITYGMGSLSDEVTLIVSLQGGAD